MLVEDTIAAVATAIGEGGIGIVRISGPLALEIVCRIFRPVSGRSLVDSPSHTAVYGHVYEPQTGMDIDEVLILVMRAPRSYTREEVVEIHCHGGPVPLRHILSLVLDQGARLAEPGEFTKRAFLNGRLDLSQAEAVIDVIRAKTDASLRLAVGQLAGSFSALIRGLRQRILGLIARMEVTIDFPEEDIEELTGREVAEALDNICSELDSLLATVQTGRILREGLATAIIGKPNVGKSSILNALLGVERAIVTEIPGTTRDIIEEYVNIGGIPLRIVDTAGIHETADVVERLGVERSRQVASAADLILLVLDASAPLSAEDQTVLSMLSGRQSIIIINKTDLPSVLELAEVSRIAGDRPIIRISALERSGISDLERSIGEMVFSGQISQAECAFVSNVRHAHLLREVFRRLSEALTTVRGGLPPDCVIVDMRAAWEMMGEITGETAGEDILDEIFSKFCIGK